jgi:outer membrane protein assembly factor BamB
MKANASRARAHTRASVGASVLVVSMIATGAPPVPAGAADWPQWRGPARDGSAPGAELPAPLPAELRLVWQAEVGAGHASPVVAGARVFVHTREGEDEVIRALDLATGREVWRHADPTPYTMNPAAMKHGKGPKSTPIVAGDTVCTLGIAGRLSCLEAATGRVRWQHDFAGRFDATAPDFGTAMSPAVVGGRLVAHVGGLEKGALTAFDLASGKEVWRWDVEGPGYASPIEATFDGVAQIVTQTRAHVLAVSPESGEELWRVPLKTPYVQNIVTPIVHGDTLIYSGLYNPVVAVRPGRDGAGKWTATEVWRSAEVSMYMSSPVLLGGALIGFTEKRSGQLFALDAATGRTLWLGEPRQGDNAALIAADDRLLVQNVSGEIAIGAVGADGWKPEKRYTVADSATWAHPALVGDRLVIKDAQAVTVWSFR